MGFSDRMVGLANRLISNTEVSAGFSLVSTVPGYYDPTTSTFIAATTSTKTLQGVIQNFSEKLVDGVSVKLGDIKIIVDQTQLGTTEPSQNDNVTLNSKSYSVLRADPTYAGPAVAYWTLHLRQGE